MLRCSKRKFGDNINSKIIKRRNKESQLNLPNVSPIIRLHILSLRQTLSTFENQFPRHNPFSKDKNNIEIQRTEISQTSAK